MKKADKIFVAGHKGLIGSAIVRRLVSDGFTNVIVRGHSELDLCSQPQVRRFFERTKPDYVFFSAGKVGGVFANNTYRADFIYQNLTMQSNVIHASFLSGVKKLVFLSSADVYPKGFCRPIKEAALLSGPLESTCEPFALAKICGMKMCESYNRQYGTSFISVIAPNVYGPNQRYDTLNAQVIPSLIKKFHEAKETGLKEVMIWGTGKPVRDFLFADDLAAACLLLCEKADGAVFFNVGTGHGYTILKLAETIKNAVGYKGRIVFDSSRPDGVHKKLLDVSKIRKLGWQPATPLLDGIRQTYKRFLEELEKKEVRTSRIHHIAAMRKDTNVLSKIRSVKRFITPQEQPKSYKNKVVIKPWGFEFLVFENKQTAVWILFISSGNSTSMHCHPKKKTSLIILSGTGTSSTLASRNYLRGGDAVVLEKCVFHATKVISNEGMYLLEIESPPLKTDLVRFEDKYGRERSGYEGVSGMRASKIDEYGYFSFEETVAYSRYAHQTDKFTVKFEVFANESDFKKRFKNDSLGLYTACRGKICDSDGNVILATGDTQKADVLSTAGALHIEGKTVLMKTYSKDK